MPIPVYEKAGEAKVTVEPSRSELLVVWYKFAAGGTFTECANAQADAVRQYRLKFIVGDTSSTVGVPAPTEQEYLISTIFPRLKQAGLKAIVTVVPQSAVTRMGAKRWSSSGSTFGFAMYEAASVEDAHALLAKEYPAEREAA